MLWVEKYRPKTLDEYVFVDDRQAEIILNWVMKKEIPNLLLSGTPGVGKTTLAKILFNELEVPDGDLLTINASAERGIDTIRDKITNFASTMPIGDFKYILLDEADMLTKQAQMPLRNMMEQYLFTRFVLTCNYPEKIEEALQSRFVHFHIKKTDKTMFFDRAKNILEKEKITYEDDVLSSYVDATYPDLRSCIKNLQLNSETGVLKDPSEARGSEQDYLIKAIALFQKQKFDEARKLIISNTRPIASEYTDLYRILYENLDWWTSDSEIQKKLILVIAEGVRWNDHCGDPEINFSATLINMELSL